MILSRRQFGMAGSAAMALGGCARVQARAGAPHGGYRSEVVGYGALETDRAGFLDLPRGFSYRVLSRAGEIMDDGFLVPDNFDGMGCLPLGQGRIALVRNHELGLDDATKGPTGGRPALEQRLTGNAAFDRAAGGSVLPGGTTTVILDVRSGQVLTQHLSLAGTLTNCAGGTTPWGTWLSCEETLQSAPACGQSHGWVFEVPAARVGLADPGPLKAMGRFRHEAAAVDPASGIVYLTEDREDGLFYRFIPQVPGQLAQGGRLQALGLHDGGTDSRNWTGENMRVGEPRHVRWIELEDVESPADDLRLRGRAAGAVVFARGEGIHLGTRADGSCEFFFTCTSGGQARIGQIMRYAPTGGAAAHDVLSLFVESRDAKLFDYGDNLIVASWGHLIVCEDRSGDAVNFLRGVTPEGRVYTLARLNAPTELAGACFAPDGKTLFVNAYAPGRTLAITGPWHLFSTRLS